jgi:MFS family permease
MFQAGRFFAGLGIGILVTIVPMYISEMSHPTKRGWLVGNHAIFLVFGYMLSSWVGFSCYFATSVNESFAWRFPLCLQVLFPAILLAGSPMLPRSPRWLLSKDRVDEAWTVVRRIRSNPDDPDDIVAKEEFYQIREQIVLERKKRIELGQPLWQAVWTKKSYRKRMMIGFMTQWGAEFCGPLIINNYAVILYTSLGATGYMPLLLSALWLTTAGLIYNPGGAWLQDKVNSRRGMLLVGTAGCLFCTTMLVVCSAVWGGTSNKVGNGFGIFFIFLYLAFQG